eukprot:CAMPEP_0198111026 /NCGR_PEP_ID=MMETSP1442-20131203/3010_1 /TAXON_ID= /ORGANISM="Craspedostauros australis, Strain CCMP3328" /LENGTH=252 /DNA_ID=CAMNT_0043767303 /DNA_START=104 /DNA_END=862 /DNA_ORIENTATION=+
MKTVSAASSASSEPAASSGKYKIFGPALLRTFRCLWILEELGADYEHLAVLPHSEELKKATGIRKVPVLITPNGFTVSESSAINTYLCDTFCNEHPTLVPRAGSHERARYDQTISVLTSDLDAQGICVQLKYEHMGEIYGYIPEAVKQARKHFNKTNRSLIKQLQQEGPYLMGKHFTPADPIYVHLLQASQVMGWDDKWKDVECMRNYMALCTQRPAYKKVHAVRVKEMEGASRYGTRQNVRSAKTKQRSKL